MRTEIGYDSCAALRSSSAESLHLPYEIRLSSWEVRRSCAQSNLCVCARVRAGACVRPCVRASVRACNRNRSAQAVIHVYRDIFRLRTSTCQQPPSLRRESRPASGSSATFPMDPAVGTGPIETAVLDLFSGTRERSRLPSSARYKSFRALPGIRSPNNELQLRGNRRKIQK